MEAFVCFESNNERREKGKMKYNKTGEEWIGSDTLLADIFLASTVVHRSLACDSFIIVVI